MGIRLSKSILIKVELGLRNHYPYINPFIGKGMSIINQFLGLYIMAVIAVFVLTVTATIPVSIAQVQQETEQEGESGDLGDPFGNTSSDGEGRLSFGNNTQGNATYSLDEEGNPEFAEQ